VKLKLVTSAAIAAAALVLAATAGASAAPKAVSGVEWKGDSDKAVAVTIGADKNTTRTNASGLKITSNAHSADFPGVYFIWDSKQKDNGYLKVEASKFDDYESFTLTAKESNTYWDFVIAPADGQKQTADGCYVFYIPKANGNKNINMVFLGDWVEKEKKVDPIVKVGFIGHYLFNDKVLSTSFLWLPLEKDQCIDKDTVDAAYEEWFATGGLEKDDSKGWGSSGYNPKHWASADKICYEDFADDMLEGLYREYYVATGYKLPIEVNLGFIGWYLDANGIPRTTSPYWQNLTKENPCIDWDAVEAFYEDWSKAGSNGLPLPEGLDNVWQTSGFASFTFKHRENICYDDLSESQLEGYYRQYYVDPGYELPEVAETYHRYLSYVSLWNDLWGNDPKNNQHDKILSDSGGLAHYHALVAKYGEPLPAYWHFDEFDQALYDYWAGELELGLKAVCLDRGDCDVDEYYAGFNPDLFVNPPRP